MVLEKRGRREGERDCADMNIDAKMQSCWSLLHSLYLLNLRERGREGLIEREVERDLSSHPPMYSLRFVCALTGLGPATLGYGDDALTTERPGQPRADKSEPT